MNWYRGAVGKVFEVIGSMPEDALVRMPFYGREYRRVFDHAAEACSSSLLKMRVADG